MAYYHFDASIYGNPNYPIGQSQTDQFKKGVGELGRGLYRDYNPTGPLPVQIMYRWSGAKLAAFRLDWQASAFLNHGADWFTIDLPLMINHNQESDTSLFPYRDKMDFIYAVEIGTSGTGSPDTGFISDFFGNTNIGNIEGKKLLGLVINSAYILGSNDVMLVRFGGISPNGILLPGTPNKTQIEFEFIDTGEILTLTASTDSYTINSLVSAPIATADWRANIGETRLVSIRPVVQDFQRYDAHFRSPFSVSMKGYDLWDVRFDLEIDVTERVIPV